MENQALATTTTDPEKEGESTERCLSNTLGAPVISQGYAENVGDCAQGVPDGDGKAAPAPLKPVSWCVRCAEAGVRTAIDVDSKAVACSKCSEEVKVEAKRRGIRFGWNPAVDRGADWWAGDFTGWSVFVEDVDACIVRALLETMARDDARNEEKVQAIMRTIESGDVTCAEADTEPSDHPSDPEAAIRSLERVPFGAPVGSVKYVAEVVRERLRGNIARRLLDWYAEREIVWEAFQDSDQHNPRTAAAGKILRDEDVAQLVSIIGGAL